MIQISLTLISTFCILPERFYDDLAGICRCHTLILTYYPSHIAPKVLDRGFLGHQLVLQLGFHVTSRPSIPICHWLHASLTIASLWTFPAMRRRDLESPSIPLPITPVAQSPSKRLSAPPDHVRPGGARQGSYCAFYPLPNCTRPVWSNDGTTQPRHPLKTTGYGSAKGSPSHPIHLPQYCRRRPGREAHIVIPLDMSVRGDSGCLCCTPYSWDDRDGGRYDLPAHVPLAGSEKRQACSAALSRRCYKL